MQTNSQNQKKPKQMNPETASFPWLSYASLSGIDPGKLQMLQSLLQNGHGKSQAELLPFLLSAMRTSQKNGMQFNAKETELIVEALKAGKSKQEAARIDQMVRMLRSSAVSKK